uniref:Uncharacterized protein n=1 Tax=Romanomermis culicivorax TaxID=13658 RepID=A0A915KV30_ROMCU
RCLCVGLYLWESPLASTSRHAYKPHKKFPEDNKNKVKQLYEDLVKIQNDQISTKKRQKFAKLITTPKEFLKKCIVDKK